MTTRGRPAFKVTARVRKKVEELVSCGMSEDDIARAIGCSRPTLREHLMDELLTGRAKRRSEVIELLFKTAREGNVSAQKQLEQLTALAGTGRQPEADAPERQPRLGKKEQAVRDAHHPDASTPLGDLMAQRQKGPLN